MRWYFIAVPLLMGCQAAAPGFPEQRAVAVTSGAESAPSPADTASDAAFWVDGADPASGLVLSAAEAGGIEIYRLDGTPAGSVPGRPVEHLDLRYDFPLLGSEVDLVVAYDPAVSVLVAYALDPGSRSLRDVTATEATIAAEVEGLCMYRSSLSGKFYVFVTAAGSIRQWQLYAREGGVAARLVREVPVGLGATRCAVHDRDSILFFLQEGLGVWAIDADPESEGEKRAVDLVEPFGGIGGDVAGIAIHEFADGGGYLLVSDADAGRLQVYDLRRLEHVGALDIIGSGSVDAVAEPGALAASSVASPPGERAQGLLAVSDEGNENANSNYKLVGWASVAAALDLGNRPGHDPAAAGAPATAIVSASVETAPVESFGDAADDPAIWVHPTDPGLSLIIGTQKRRGLNVYDLSGDLLQSIPAGRINNVDLRYGFDLAGRPVDVVAASNRSTDGIDIYVVDPRSRTLIEAADGVIPTGMRDPYGLCMYRSRRSGEYYVFVNDKDGLMRQWLLTAVDRRRVGAKLVREFSLGSQPEGCAADDETGALYVGEENVGFWRYSAEPSAEQAPVLVDSVGENGNLTADVEGIAIYYGPGGAGYLLVSNQGADNYALYQRHGENRFVGLFHVIADDASGVDGISETDGLDVSSAYLGAGFPHGLFVAQDGRNIAPAERQNFKLVPWERIAAAMKLEMYEGFDPRAVHADE